MALDHNSAESQINLAHQLCQHGKLAEAVRLYLTALPQRPNDLAARYNLAQALFQLGHADEALEHASAATVIDPRFVDAHVLMGAIRNAQGELLSALDSYKRALAIKSDYADVYGNIGGILREQGKLDEAIAAFREAVRLNPTSAAQHSNLLYTLWFHRASDPQDIFREHQLWAQRHADPLAGEIRPWPNDPSPDRMLRVGLVSPDFRYHSVGRLIEPVLAHHDHERFEILLYSDVVAEDALTQRIFSHANQVHRTATMNDAALTNLIRSHAIDVLVDLALHTAGNRLLLFARKPAPVQITYLGYCATSGLRTMDYCITDPQLDPPTEATSPPLHTERLLHLPKCYWTYRPQEAFPPVADPPPVERNGYVTFGSFNNFAKVNGAVIALWSKLLLAIPGARLLIVIKGGEANNPHMRATFSSAGISAEHIRIVPFAPAMQYLNLLGEADIALDPFPFNGGTTTLDSLYMGVPVITLAGRIATARAGATLLTNVGLAELITHSPDAYLQAAVELAADRPRLAALRCSLRARLQASPIADSAQFTADLEALYRRAWRNWCSSSPTAAPPPPPPPSSGSPP
jgi:predicted O-linked N-acetylglucosamine transferase (SPINDLY family)